MRDFILTTSYYRFWTMSVLIRQASQRMNIYLLEVSILQQSIYRQTPVLRKTPYFFLKRFKICFFNFIFLVLVVTYGKNLLLIHIFSWTLQNVHILIEIDDNDFYNLRVFWIVNFLKAFGQSNPKILKSH